MRRLTTMLIAIAALVTPAFAHTGASSGFALVDGLVHPLLGGDHLLAMIGVGLWAGMVGGKARWIWPMAFVAVMAVGGGLALSGFNLAHVETLILLSLVGIGAAVGLRLRPSLAIGTVVCGLFALAHGHAHGTELPFGVSAPGDVAGFLVATAALHAVGVTLGMIAVRDRSVARIAGAAIAITGAVLALS